MNGILQHVIFPLGFFCSSLLEFFIITITIIWSHSLLYNLPWVGLPQITLWPIDGHLGYRANFLKPLPVKKPLPVPVGTSKQALGGGDDYAPHLRGGRGGYKERLGPPAKPRAGVLPKTDQPAPAEAGSHPFTISFTSHAVCHLPMLPWRAPWGSSVSRCAACLTTPPPSLHQSERPPGWRAFLFLDPRPAQGLAQHLLCGILVRRSKVEISVVGPEALGVTVLPTPRTTLAKSLHLHAWVPPLYSAVVVRLYKLVPEKR